MLNPGNDYMLYLLKEERTRQYLREAEMDRLLNEISPQQPSWWSYPMRKALHNFGHLLTTLGQRLQRIETRPA